MLTGWIDTYNQNYPCIRDKVLYIYLEWKNKRESLHGTLIYRNFDGKFRKESPFHKYYLELSNES